MSENSTGLTDGIHSYYFSFARTGVAEIDAVLVAIANAGSGFHSTDEWASRDYGESYIDRIQAAAQSAASELTRLQQELSAAKRERDEAREQIARAFDGRVVEAKRRATEALELYLLAEIDCDEYDARITASVHGEMIAETAAKFIRSLSPPVEATDESVSPPAIESSDEMVERVARALCINHGSDPDGRSPEQRHVVEASDTSGVARIITDWMGPLWKMWESDARAALAVIQGGAQ